MLKQLAVAVCLTLPLASFAAQEKKEMTPQQRKMADCNKQARDQNLAGDERKKFMSACLSGGATRAEKSSAQQDKMTACNKQAGDKKLAGEERKKFMAACLRA
jgi:hypothetical protein